MSERLALLGTFASSPWPAFILRRFISLVIVLCALVTVTFMMVRLIPGDPAELIGGINATPVEVEKIRADLGLNEPVVYQFEQYWLHLARGDLGNSYVEGLRSAPGSTELGVPVVQIIQERAGSSIQLAAVALLLVMLVSVPGGIWAGIFTSNGRHRGFEVVFTGVTSVVGSIPEFLTATFLVFAFAVSIQLLPVAGQLGWQSLVLPTVALSLRPIAILARLVRVETLNVLVQDYMRTASSKRLPQHILIIRHMLPNVISAALTIGGLLFAGLVGGAVVIENVFARAGLGSQLVTSVLLHDYPVIQGVMLVLGTTVVLVNAIVDVLLGVMDPRSLVRHT